MHPKTRALKSRYRAEYTELTQPDDPKAAAVRKPKAHAPSLKGFAAHQTEGEAWRDRKRAGSG